MLWHSMTKSSFLVAMRVRRMRTAARTVARGGHM